MIDEARRRSGAATERGDTAPRLQQRLQRSVLPCYRGRRSLNPRRRPFWPATMKTKIVLSFASFLLLFGFNRAEAQLTYTLSDLGTLGGTSSVANSVNGQGRNAAGMIVG